MCHSLKKEKWYRIAGGIHLPRAKRDEIWHQFNGNPDECSTAAWEYWLKNHPSPSWERIAEGLFQIWEHEDLKELEKDYPTGAVVIYIIIPMHDERQRPPTYIFMNNS
jgi:hypothetical protein